MSHLPCVSSTLASCASPQTPLQSVHMIPRTLESLVSMSAEPATPTCFAAQHTTCAIVMPFPIIFPATVRSSRTVSIRADTSPCISVHYKSHTIRFSDCNLCVHVTALCANRASLTPHFVTCHTSGNLPVLSDCLAIT